MKKLLIGLLTLASLSSFAKTGLKVGSKAIHTGTRGNVVVTIIAIQTNGNYVVKRDEFGTVYDATFRNVIRDQLAKL
jgi:hypothetical protein